MKISICCLILLTAMIAPGNLYAQEKQTVGWIEKAHITPGDITLDAKLDTGADGTSVNAVDINKFERDGKTWARFTIDDKKGHKVTLEREIVGVIKRSSAMGAPIRNVTWLTSVSVLETITWKKRWAWSIDISSSIPF